MRTVKKLNTKRTKYPAVIAAMIWLVIGCGVPNAETKKARNDADSANEANSKAAEAKRKEHDSIWVLIGAGAANLQDGIDISSDKGADGTKPIDCQNVGYAYGAAAVLGRMAENLAPHLDLATDEYLDLVAAAKKLQIQLVYPTTSCKSNTEYLSTLRQNVIKLKELSDKLSVARYHR